MATPKPTTEDTVVSQNKDIFGRPLDRPKDPRYEAEVQELLEISREQSQKEIERTTKPASPVEEDKPEGLRPGTQLLTDPSPEGRRTEKLVTWDPVLQEYKSLPVPTPEQIKILEDPNTRPELLEQTAINVFQYSPRQANRIMEEIHWNDKSRLERGLIEGGQKALGTLYYYGSPLMLLGSSLTTGTAAVAQILPNPDSYLGDLAQTAVGKTLPLLMSGARGYVPESQKEATDQLDKELEQLSRNIYERVATGEVLDKILSESASTYENTLVSDLLGPVKMARHVEVLDALITKKEAEQLEQLAKKAGRESDALTWQVLSSDLGREIISLPTEILYDPLMLVGSASKASSVVFRGVNYNVGPDVTRAIDSLTQAPGLSAIEKARAEELILKALLEGDEESIKIINKVIEQHKEVQILNADKAVELSQKAKKDPSELMAEATQNIKADRKIIDEAIASTRIIKEAQLTPEIIAKFGGDTAAATNALKAQNAAAAAQLKALERQKNALNRALLQLKDPKKATKYLETTSGQYLSRSSNHKMRATHLEKILEDGYNVSQMIKTSGAFRLHLPFDNITYNPMPITSKMKPVAGDTLSSISSRTGVNSNDLAKLNKVTEEVLEQMIQTGQKITIGIGTSGSRFIIGRPVKALVDPLRVANVNNIRTKVVNAGNDTSVLGAGERLIYALTEGGKSGFPIVKTAMKYWDALAGVVGTRWFQPWIAKHDYDAAIQYYLTREVDANKLAQVYKGSSVLVRLQKAAPQIWKDYQTAYGKYIRAISTRQEQLLNSCETLVRVAEDLAAKRLKENPTKFSGTTGISVIDEAGKYIEQGRAFPEELMGLAASIRKLQEEVAVASGKELEEVRQALQNIARFVSGDTEIFRETSVRIKNLQEELVDITRVTVQKVDEQLKTVLSDVSSFEEKITSFRRISAEENSLKNKIKSEKRKPTEAETKQLDSFKKKRESLAEKKKGQYKGVGHAKEQIKDLMAIEKQIQASLDAYRRALKTGQPIPESVVSRTLKESLEQIQTKRKQLSELEQEAVKNRPKLRAERFKVGNDQDYVRALHKWEIDLWDGFKALSKDFTMEQQLQAVLYTFKRGDKPFTSPDFVSISKEFRGTSARQPTLKVPKQRTAEDNLELSRLEIEYTAVAREQYGLIRAGTATKNTEKRIASLDKQLDEIEARVEKIEAIEDVAVVDGVAEAAKYPTVIGRRYEDVPDDIQPMVSELSELLESYTELYKSHGFDFVKEPEDIIRVFGVVDYVPHLKYNPSQDVSRVLPGGHPREEALVSGGIDATLMASMNLDAAKLRSLSGTMEEINSLAKYSGEDWMFSTTPQLLYSRLANSNNGIETKVLFTSLLRTGVMRQFDNLFDARQAGFVPVLNRPKFQLDMQTLMMGTQEQLVNAKGGVANKFPFEEMLREINSPKYVETKVISSWAQDISQFNNIQKVEQTLGTIRAIQVMALTEPTLARFLSDDGLLDVVSIWKRTSQNDHSNHLAGLEARLVKEQAKVDKYVNANKPIPKTVAENLENLTKRLDESSEAYAREKARILNSSWKQVSDEVNELVSDISNRVREIPDNPILNKLIMDKNTQRLGFNPLSVQDLKIYFNEEQAIGRLYIQEAVQESLKVLTSPTGVSKLEGKLKVIYETTRKLNNWWKLINTVISPMFTARNVMGNYLSNILDVGVGGALNVNTNIKAARLSELVDYYATYGSIDKAEIALSAPRKASENNLAYLARKAKLVDLRKAVMYDPSQAGVLLKNQTIDIGDGVIRTLDDALKILSDNGVLSGTSNFRLDIDQTIEFFNQAAHRLSMKEVEKSYKMKLKKSYSVGEDVAIVGGSYITIGGDMIPIHMFKGLGKAIARRTENHARAVNFIANMKRGKSIEDSVQHVFKFLFDYNDLTPIQRDYLRVLIPFFTWNFKNIILQSEMILKNPSFYVTYNRIFYHFFPMLEGINEADLIEKETGVPQSVGTLTHQQRKMMSRVQYYPDYKMHVVRIPTGALPDSFGLPKKGFDIEGLGTPQESYAEYIGLFERSFKDGFKPLAAVEGVIARSHFLANWAYSTIAQRDPFYGENIEELKMRDANDVANLLNTLNEMDNQAADYLAKGIREAYGVYEGVEPNTWYFSEDRLSTFVRTGPNPLGRVIREAAMVNDHFFRSTLTKEGKIDPEKNTPEQLSFLWRMINANTGLKIKQQASTGYLEYYYNNKRRQIVLDQLEAIGLMEDGRVKK
jgi:LysM repeat protein/ASC-1-like (ASCH) protein